MQFSLAKAVYVYPQDGWATDVLFERGNDRTIAQTPNDVVLKTRDEAIEQAKAVLRMARRLEHRYGTARTAENLNRSFELCGHSIELLPPEQSWDDADITHETLKYLIATAQDMFYDDCEGDIAQALENSIMGFAMRALRQLCNPALILLF